MQKRIFSAFMIAGLAVLGMAQSTEQKTDNPHPWPMDHANPARTNKTWAIGPQTGQIEWQRQIVGGTFGIACDAQGGAILGATFHDEWWAYDIHAYRFKPNGDIDWKTEVNPYPWGASQAVNSFPAVYGKRNIVLNSTNSELLRINPAGIPSVAYQHDPSFIGGTSPAVTSDGTIFQQFGLTATRFSQTGAVQWQTGALSNTDIAVSPTGDLALGGVRTLEPHGSTDLTILNSNGTPRVVRTSVRGRTQQVCFDEKGNLYGGNGQLSVSTGLPVWSGVFGGGFTALDGNGQLLIVSSSQLVAYDRVSGVQAWLRFLIGSVVQSVSIDGNNRVFYTTSNGYIGCRDFKGNLIFERKVCDAFTTQLSISVDRKAFAVGRIGATNYFLFKLQ